MNGFTNFVSSAAEFGMRFALEAGAAAAFVAAAAIVINLLARRRLSPGHLALVWSLVLLRLVLPAGPESALSFQNFARSVMSEETTGKDLQALHGGYSSGFPAGATQYAPYGYSKDNPMRVVRPAQPPAPTLGDRVAATAQFVWLFGALGVLAFTLGTHARFFRRVKRAGECDDESLLRLWRECCETARVRREIPIVLFDGVSQPAIMGVFRPKLLLPPDAMELSDTELRMIMLHELAHVRRWDVAANWGMLVARSIQWWNPIYWLAAARFKALREQACDRFVIEATSGAARAGYGELLLKLAARTPDAGWRVMVPASLLGFNTSIFRSRSVRSRLSALRMNIAPRRRTKFVVAILVAAIAICGFTDATSRAEPPARKAQSASEYIGTPRDGKTAAAKRRDSESPNWFPAVGVEIQEAPLAMGQPTRTKPYDPKPAVLISQTYEIGAAIERIARDSSSPKDARTMFEERMKDYVKVLNTKPASSVVFADDGSTMTVNTFPAAHFQIADNLAAWEKAGLVQIKITCRHITAPRDITSSLGSIWLYDRTPTLEVNPAISSATHPVGQVRMESRTDLIRPLALAVLKPKQVEELIAKANSEKGVKIIEAPKITVTNGQTGSYNFGTESPFVVGLANIGGELGNARQPKIHVAPEGFSLDLRAITADDGEKVRLEESFQFSSIGDVFNAPADEGRAKIQVPRVNSTRFSAAQEIGPDDTVLFGCVPSFEKEEFEYVLLTAKRLDEKEEEDSVQE